MAYDRQPVEVDALFATVPELFAYTLPSREERECLAVGDDVKLFFNVDGFKYPRARWLVVTEKSDPSTVEFKGVLANRYDAEMRREFGEIVFDYLHIYRLPLGRLEVENDLFDVSFRQIKA